MAIQRVKSKTLARGALLCAFASLAAAPPPGGQRPPPPPVNVVVLSIEAYDSTPAAPCHTAVTSLVVPTNPGSLFPNAVVTQACQRVFANPDVTSCSSSTLSIPSTNPARGATMRGDFTVKTQADAAAASCVRVVDGNFSLLADYTPTPSDRSDHVVSMPNLVEVTGDVHATASPRFAPNQGNFGVALPDAPSLDTIGGDLTLEVTDPDARHRVDSGHHFVFGFASLQALAHNVQVNNAFAETEMDTLANLTSIDGGLTITWTAPAEFHGDKFFPQLARIGGEFELVYNDLVNTLLPELTEVGSFKIMAPSGATSGAHLGISHTLFFPKLATVAATFSANLYGGCAFPALTRIGAFREPAGACGNVVASSSLSVGSIDIENSSCGGIPLPMNTVVDPGGSIVIQNNARLCDCQVQGFLTGIGRNGTASISGNASCPAPCPASTCS